MSKYMFYPFDDGTAQATLTALAPGVGGNPGNYVAAQIGAVYRDDGTFPGSLLGAGANDEVWVIGHAAEGMKVMGDSKKNLIDQTEIVKRMKNCGLRAGENCKVVMYACESGKGGKDSLAAKVASSLKTNKYACANNVWGFTKKVSMAAHGGALCVSTGKNSKKDEIWQDYTWHAEYALINVPPNQ